jgi:hypothetical protein
MNSNTVISGSIVTSDSATMANKVWVSSTPPATISNFSPRDEKLQTIVFRFIKIENGWIAMPDSGVHGSVINWNDAVFAATPEELTKALVVHVVRILV